MKIIPNWRQKALFAYSMWFGVYIPFFGIILVPELVFAWTGCDMSPLLRAILLCLAFVCAWLGAMIDQGIASGTRQPRRPRK